MGRKDKTDRALAEPAAVTVDPRPRFLPAVTPEGLRRIRRMPPPQLFTQLHNFRALEILERPFSAATSATQLDEIGRFLQRCLVEPDADVLAYPGRRGLQRVLCWSQRVRAELAAMAAEFMEI